MDSAFFGRHLVLVPYQTHETVARGATVGCQSLAVNGLVFVDLVINVLLLWLQLVTHHLHCIVAFGQPLTNLNMKWVMRENRGVHLTYAYPYTFFAAHFRFRPE